MSQDLKIARGWHEKAKDMGDHMAVSAIAALDKLEAHLNLTNPQ